MTAWMDQAACADIGPGLFYPRGEKPDAGYYDEARRICGGCPVRAECLDYALAVDDRFGMWGGLSPQEREKVRKQRGIKRIGEDSAVNRHTIRRDDALLTRYEALIERHGTSLDLAAELGITVGALNKRMERARRRRDQRQVAA